MKSREEYLSELSEIIDKYYIDNKLINKIKKEFIRKHLNQRVPNQIFASLMDMKSLEVNEMICIAKMCCEYGIESMNPKLFFTDVELSAYEGYIAIEEELDEIILNNVNVNPLNPMSFVSTFVPLKEIYQFYKNRLIGYDFNQQREAKIIEIGSKNTKIKVQNINRKSVDDIKEMMSKNDYEPTTITVNVTLKEGKEPNIHYNKETNTLKIKPNLDVDSIDWTCPVMVDGQHRFISAYECIVEAMKNNRLDEIKGSLHISVQCWTVEQAKKFIVTEQKGNSFDASYVRSLEEDDSMKVTKMIENEGNKETNYLYDNVAETWNQMRVLNKVTERTVIADALKTIKGLKLTSPFDLKFKIPKIVECLQMTSEYITLTKYDGNDSEFRNSIYCSPYSWALYLMIAGEVIKSKDYIDQLIAKLDKLIGMEAEMIALRLNNKACSLYRLETFLKNSVLNNIEIEEVSVSE